MTPDDFVEQLKRDVPEVQPLILEHLEDYDEVLLHVLTAALRRHAMEAFGAEGRSSELSRLLGVLDAALVEGGDEVQNAVAVSFVEDTGWWDPAMRPFIEAWPPGSAPGSGAAAALAAGVVHATPIGSIT